MKKSSDTRPVPVTPSSTLSPESAAPATPVRDAFISSEVSEKSSVPGKDPRTRS